MNNMTEVKTTLEFKFNRVGERWHTSGWVESDTPEANWRALRFNITASCYQGHTILIAALMAFINNNLQMPSKHDVLCVAFYQMFVFSFYSCFCTCFNLCQVVH